MAAPFISFEHSIKEKFKNLTLTNNHALVNSAHKMSKY